MLFNSSSPNSPPRLLVSLTLPLPRLLPHEHMMSGKTDRHTDRQEDTDRQTHRQTDTQTDTQTHRQTDRQIHRQTDRQSDRQTDTDKQTKKMIEIKNINKITLYIQILKSKMFY